MCLLVIWDDRGNNVCFDKVARSDLRAVHRDGLVIWQKDAS